MNYNDYNYDYNSDYKKKKRKAQSVQDMINSSPSSGKNRNSSRSRSRSRMESYEAPSLSGGLGQSAGVIYCVLLGLCLMAALLNYRSVHKNSAYHYPIHVVTVSGVLSDIYGGQSETASVPQTPTAAEGEEGVTPAPTPVPMNDMITATEGVSGAAMLLDAGGGVDGYSEAATYSELLTQLDGALSAGDVTFVGSKIGYTDDATGSHLGYPQSVVEHFVSYMAANSDKRQLFMDMIGDDSKYSATNGAAIIVALPLIKYAVTTSYDETTFSFSGFSEQTINSNQAASVQPMLPCMYYVKATCPSWAQPVEGNVEATFGENLQVNFGSN